MTQGSGQVDRVDLDAAGVGLRGRRRGRRGRRRRDDGQRHPPGRRGGLRRVPPPPDPPAQPGPGRARHRLPRGLDLQDVGPLRPGGLEGQRVPRGGRDVGGDHLLPLLPPDRLAAPGGPQLGGAAEVDLGRLGRQDVERDRERDRRPGLGRAVEALAPQVGPDRVPGQALHADVDRRRGGRPLRALQQRRQRDADRLPADPDDQVGADRALDPDPGPPLRRRPDRPRPVRPGLHHAGIGRRAARPGHGRDDPPGPHRQLGRRAGIGRVVGRGPGWDGPVDVERHLDRRARGPRSRLVRRGSRESSQQGQPPGRDELAPSCAHTARHAPGPSAGFRPRPHPCGRSCGPPGPSPVVSCPLPIRVGSAGRPANSKDSGEIAGSSRPEPRRVGKGTIVPIARHLAGNAASFPLCNFRGSARTGWPAGT